MRDTIFLISALAFYLGLAIGAVFMANMVWDFATAALPFYWSRGEYTPVICFVALMLTLFGIVGVGLTYSEDKVDRVG